MSGKSKTQPTLNSMPLPLARVDRRAAAPPSGTAPLPNVLERDSSDFSPAQLQAILQMQQRASSSASQPFEALPFSSVVKINVVITTPDYVMPWQVQPQEEASGTGFVLENRMILTNAHVVDGCSIVRVKKHDSAKLHKARVIAIGHVCDLAVLTVDKDDFWQNTPALSLVDFPSLYEDVMVIGYPVGGDNVCVTRGVVSRIDTMAYSTRMIDHLPQLPVVQIDAAINPGNSGGPAVNARGEVVGVAFCTLIKASNVGYLIPLPVIRTFLGQVVHHKKFLGFPEISIDTQDMMNDALRTRFNMKEAQSGVLITSIEPLAAASKVLKRHDVVLAVDGIEVANDGTVEFRENVRLNYSALTNTKAVGDQVHFQVLREGNVLELDVKIEPVPKLCPCFHGFDSFPSYFIVGGIVFTKMSIPLVNQVFSDDDDSSRFGVMSVFRQLQKPKKTPTDEFVVVLRSLIADVNFGYELHGLPHVRSVNGEKINNLKGLISAVMKSTGKFLEFSFKEEVVVLEREQCRETEVDILTQHSIASPVSKDLTEFYKSLISKTSPSFNARLDVD